MSSFEGLGILCFYNHGLMQGHLIDNTTNESPYSLAGRLLPDHVDPQHNDCMEPDDFYTVLVQSHTTSEDNTVSLILRRQKENDASGLSSHEHEQEINDGYQFSFVTHHFLSGQEASTLQQKYFTGHNHADVNICIGDVKYYKTE
ncbi:hypothetical protein BDF21DRAFT_422573 [Thamnidium elegans]|nr:hypothetical protein BDF21DRAFT_422573 [Thamnidium elegans]